MDSGSRLSFSRYFNIPKEKLLEEGYFNISLFSDLPLFIDPFHLFFSQKEEYQNLHKQIIDYLVFLRNMSFAKGGGIPSSGEIDAYYTFPEINQNWLGFTFRGNKGHGLGRKFAITLNANFNSLFRNLDASSGVSHLEKLTIIADGVGKDTVSDLTTNLIHGFLAEKTEAFTLKYIAESKTKKFTIKKALFDFKKGVWIHKTYTLPAFGNDYVLLTPNDLLTKNDTWINRKDFIDNFAEIPFAASNPALREQLSSYLKQKIKEHGTLKIHGRTHKPYLSITKKTQEAAAWDTVENFPETIDIYIAQKEKKGKQALVLSEEMVAQTAGIYESKVVDFANKIGLPKNKPTSYEEMIDRANYFKECIELHDLYQNLYIDDVPADEEWVQRMFWLVWYGSDSDVNRDPNNGLGKPDFKASQGRKDKAVAEFKFAKSSSFETNLLKQLEKYKEVEQTDKGIWVIVFFTETEEKKAKRILKKHNLDQNENYILIDARRDNKISASKIKS